MSSPFFPYRTVSEFFELNGDFPENLEDEEPEEDPCCLLYRETYPEDHEYSCPDRVKKEGREPLTPSY